MSARDAAPRFSVVVPAHNTGHLLGDAIRSVLAQTRPDFELIVVDDGSTDDTAAQAGRFSDPRITLIEQPNRGPSAARNAGIEVARGEYVSMLDSDDMLLPRYLEVMAAALDADPEAGFAYTDAFVLDTEGRRVRRTTMMHYQRPPKTPPRDPRALLRLLVDRNFVFTSVTVRRHVLERVGGFDERLWTAEDWELWLRIVAAGFPAIRPPGTLGIHGSRPGSLSTDLPRMIEGICAVYRIVLEEWEHVDDDVRAAASARLRARTRELELLRDPQPARTGAERARGLASVLLRRLRGPRLWLDSPPPEVAALLEHVSADTPPAHLAVPSAGRSTGGPR